MESQSGITIIVLNTTKNPFVIDTLKSTLQNFTDNYELIILNESLKLNEAILQAKKEWTLIFDNNANADIQNLKSFWEIRNKFDFILGFRENQNPIQKIVNIIVNYLLPTEEYIKDVYLGFKLFKTFQLQQLKLVSKNKNIFFEILYKLNKKSPYFKQIPITILDQ